MTHPHQLHATAALWRLHRSLPLLRHQVAAVVTEAADGLRSTTYGSRHPAGTHSDGAIGALLADVAEQQHWQHILDRVRNQITQACWLIRSALPNRRGVRGAYGPLPYLAAAIPAVDPLTARDVAGYLNDADRTIRRAMRLDDDRQPLPGVDCPACSTRMLQTCTAAPNRADWTVICAAGCRCRGERCPCGNPAAGVPHIWSWTTVVTGAASDQAAA